MKIALIGSKGGTGKTTTAVTLARLWRAQRPLLLDLDTQAATQNFAREYSSRAACVSLAVVAR